LLDRSWEWAAGFASVELKVTLAKTQTKDGAGKQLATRRLEDRWTWTRGEGRLLVDRTERRPLRGSFGRAVSLEDFS